MHPTKNDLPESARTKLAELLNARLADAVDLYTQAKQAHWNVKGPNFIALHKLFDDVAEEAEAYIDDLAERVQQLGGQAVGTVRAVAQRSTLPAYPTDVTDGRKHVEAFSSALAAFGKGIRTAIETSTEFGDADTADLFTEISRGVDKSLWFVEAHVG